MSSRDDFKASSVALGLSDRWRDEAKALRRWGAELQAAVLEACADELEQATKDREMEQLTLEQAAIESGLSYSTLQKQLASGRLLNVGSKHRPRVRRDDLPRKARRRHNAADSPDLVDRILAGKQGMSQIS